MRIGFVGLGKMGANMVTRLRRGGHDVVVYDTDPKAIKTVTALGAIAAKSTVDLAGKLRAPRIVWVMVPSGKITEAVIHDVAKHLSKGDTIIDGGNSNYHDTKRRAAELEAREIALLDSGTSGGVWGLENGYCMMIGGNKKAYQKAEPIFKTLAPADGYRYCGESGAGHYVKMIHNGIEYGLMQAYAEGFELLESSEYTLDLADICHLWNQGSVVRSWLLELSERAFKADPNLEKITGYVADSGEGRWTVREAMDKDVPAVALTYALMARFRSRQEESFSAKVLAALRNQFGGHAVKEREPDTSKPTKGKRK
ncbi:MAG: decarboxylating 6-phosphogluconate dehydrogenase [candidate division Zixibacteria bacterium]|nr:decarboxylating 6-phosphogluconate dehydrogenase [candidate division Zixibacteria bacterium]